MSFSEARLEALEAKVEALDAFDPEEKEIIKEMVRVWRGLHFTWKLCKGTLIGISFLSALGASALGIYMGIQSWL